MKVKHLLIEPSGKMSWVELDRERKYDDIYEGEYGYDLDQIHDLLGTDLFENVYSTLPSVVFLVDESGKLKNPPKQHNELASRLYGGYRFGDNIVGNALFFRIEGPNLVPLTLADEARLSLCLGVQLPDK